MIEQRIEEGSVGGVSVVGDKPRVLIEGIGMWGRAKREVRE